MSEDFLAQAPIWYVVFLFSTVCHEAAHALVAKWGGDLTAYVGGQVSLDPVPHIRREPFGLVILPLLMLFTTGSMIGWGSAPYDPYWQIRYPRRAALMALAGPSTNFFLALVAALTIRIGMGMEAFEVPMLPEAANLISAPGGGALEVAATFLSIMFSLNVILGVFNLLPLPPLDGFNVLGLFISERSMLRLIELSHSAGFSFFGLLIAWKLFPFMIMPVLRFAIHTLLW